MSSFEGLAAFQSRLKEKKALARKGVEPKKARGLETKKEVSKSSVRKDAPMPTTMKKTRAIISFTNNPQGVGTSETSIRATVVDDSSHQRITLPSELTVDDLENLRRARAGRAMASASLSEIVPNIKSQVQEDEQWPSATQLPINDTSDYTPPSTRLEVGKVSTLPTKPMKAKGIR
ncbi:hypothetical protein GMRT_10717 [Giardia muris]|uniref:Uncharacterized protein n=1 Tax=Giardia muris TaxID=5742 RepID=A0A4Z1T4P7_GIAMU|nr:hypothetical protein GMRT_10717 [Giardia muris]|eukprot:TNJ28963.1 hypothetical protein GMRT_10717 [Giardia muris]